MKTRRLKRHTEESQKIRLVRVTTPCIGCLTGIEKYASSIRAFDYRLPSYCFRNRLCSVNFDKLV